MLNYFRTTTKLMVWTVVAALAMSATADAAEIVLGSLTDRQHGIGGEVVALSDRVLEIRGFTYDGQAPDAFFWADTAAVPSDEGFILSDTAPTTSCGMIKLGAADGSVTYRLEFPKGTSLRGIAGGSISVWCKAFAINFGELVIPDEAAVEGLKDAIDGPELLCSTGADMSAYYDGIAPAEDISLGSIVGRAHDVSGEVYVLSDRVLEVRNFAYDGTAPDAFFWADSNAVPSGAGFILLDAAPTNSCGSTKLGASDGTVTYRLEFPEGTSIQDITGGSISVWCKEFGANFGELVIPAAVEGVLATADGPELECSEGAAMPAYDESTAVKIELGGIIGLTHDVAGEVFVLSDRVLEVRNFAYDGTAPDAFFWADANAIPSDEGFILSDAAPANSCGSTKLGASDGTVTYRLEFPEGSSIQDITGGSISVWCRDFGVNFGHLVIPDVVEGVLATADGPTLECSEGADLSAYNLSIVESPEGYNCEPLHEDMQVRWKIDGNDVLFELVGFVEEDDYLGFGVSGSDEGTEMIGADVIIGDLFNGEFRASPYVMNARSQCSNGAGVCPDEGNSTKISGVRDQGITIVRYTRTLVASDETNVDRNISIIPGESTYIAWAIGPVSADTGFPNFHSVAFPRDDVSIEFGRAVVNNCEPLIVDEAQEEPEEEMFVAAFERPVLRGVTELHATIGPSGGDRGYQAISGGRVGWGIAWYVNDLLLPVIEMERGTKYIFLVNGGVNEADSANYHPMYITSSISGGYAQLDDATRGEEQIFEGLATNMHGMFEASALGPICKYSATDSTQATLANGTYNDFFSTLKDSCQADMATVDAAAVLEFTPDADTPDLLYYQCVTHRNLGWEIRIVDPPTSATRDDVLDVEKDELSSAVAGTVAPTTPSFRGSEASGASTANVAVVSLLAVFGLILV